MLMEEKGVADQPGIVPTFDYTTPAAEDEDKISEPITFCPSRERYDWNNLWGKPWQRRQIKGGD